MYFLVWIALSWLVITRTNNTFIHLHLWDPQRLTTGWGHTHEPHCCTMFARLRKAFWLSAVVALAFWPGLCAFVIPSLPCGVCCGGHWQRQREPATASVATASSCAMGGRREQDPAGVVWSEARSLWTANRWERQECLRHTACKVYPNSIWCFSWRYATACPDFDHQWWVLQGLIALRSRTWEWWWLKDGYNSWLSMNTCINTCATTSDAEVCKEIAASLGFPPGAVLFRGLVETLDAECPGRAESWEHRFTKHHGTIGIGHRYTHQ